MSDFSRRAIQAGFSQEQAAFLDTMLAKFPHTHEADEITDLDEVIADAVEHLEEDDDEDDD